VATARRGRRYEGLVRWLGSRFVHWLACRVTGVEIEDYGGNFKAYRRDVVESTKRMWAPGKPFFPLALWAGHQVGEVTVGHQPRRGGRSRYTLGALLRINFDIITAFTTLPLTMLGVLGVACLTAGFAALVVIAFLTTAGWLAAATALVLIVIGAVFLAGGPRALGRSIARSPAASASSAMARENRAAPGGDLGSVRRPSRRAARQPTDRWRRVASVSAAAQHWNRRAASAVLSARRPALAR
jgi:hypothetical protein